MVSFLLTRLCDQMSWKVWVCVDDQSENNSFQVHQDVWCEFKTTWLYCMLWVEQILNGAKMKGRSNRFHASFGTCLYFFDYLGAGNCLLRNLPAETSSLRHCAKKGFGEWHRRVLVRNANKCFLPIWRRFHWIRSTSFFSDNRFQQGRENERKMSYTAFQSCVDTQSHYGSPCKARDQYQRGLWFLGVHIKTKGLIFKILQSLWKKS